MKMVVLLKIKFLGVLILLCVIFDLNHVVTT